MSTQHHGRKPDDPSGKKRKLVVYLTPAEKAWLSARAETPQKALVELLAREMKRAGIDAVLDGE